MFNVSIPTISDDELKKRYQHIKPVITVNGKLHYFKEFTDKELRNISYLWNREKIGEEVNDGELKVWEGHDFNCIHRYGYYGLFKPSIAEVLAQINEFDILSIKAFEIIESPETADDFYKDGLTSIIFKNGFHVSKVRLYIYGANMFEVPKSNIYCRCVKMINGEFKQSDCSIKEIQKYLNDGWGVTITLFTSEYLGFIATISETENEYVIRMTDRTILKVAK